MNVSCYVFDLSIAVMAVLTLDRTTQEAAAVIQGYHVARPLSSIEWDVLWVRVVQDITSPGPSVP